MEVLLVVILILFFFGGGFYTGRPAYAGPFGGASGVLYVLGTIVLIVVLLRLLGILV